MEGLERVRLFADADEQDRLARDLPHGERRAAARIAVRLGKDHAGQVERCIEALRRAHRILPRHAVDDEQALGRADGAVDRTAPRSIIASST